MLNSCYRTIFALQDSTHQSAALSISASGRRVRSTICLLAPYNTVSVALGKVEGIVQALGLPYSNSATGIQTQDTILEASYNCHVIPGLTFLLDLQYVVRPTGQGNIIHALALGFRVHVTL